MEYGCIGEKLSHSFSKIIHNKLYSYPYELKELNKDELDSFFNAKDFKAVNVTIPYKQAVIPYLDFISENAKNIGAVNTVVNKNGKLYGYNTDFSGLKALILKNGIELKGKKVLILGSGGTSKTAFAVAKDMKAKEILVVSRNAADGAISYSKAETEHKNAQIIINTTPVGMYPKIGVAPIDIDKFKNLSGVVDAVYNPLCSDLIVKAKLKKIPAAGGLYMLVAQAVFAAEKFLETEINSNEIERIYNEISADKSNIVLIGMPGCGKTTVGKALANDLGKQLIDTDEEIVKKAGKPIPEIFANSGEVAFRKIESEVIEEISAKQGAVISTGGGAVLNERNCELLKENGSLYFLDRDVELLAVSGDRPLSPNREKLEKIYNKRYDIYRQRADFIIKANGTVKENIDALKEVVFNENTCN